MALVTPGNQINSPRWRATLPSLRRALLAPMMGPWLLGVAASALFLLVGCDRAESPTPIPAAPVAPVNVADVQAKAERGVPEAQKALGDLYAAGRGVTQDFKQAVVWYRKAADQGHAPAQNSLGELFEAGQGGGPPSNLEAAALYRKAAEQGDEAAQYNLAVLYAFGRGVRLDEAEAVKWYRKAAEQGNALAQFNLGQRCQLGKGVPVDLVEAYKWLSLAASSIPDSAKLRDEVKSTMSREQVAEARRRIAAFAAAKSAPGQKR